MRTTARPLLLAAVGALLSTACGSDGGSGEADTTAADTTLAADTQQGDTQVPADTAGADTGGSADTTTTDTAGPPAQLTSRHLGMRIHGGPLRLSLVGRELWVGTQGLPELLGDRVIRGGLYRVNVDTGATRRFESELPTGAYYDQPEPGTAGPVPVAGVHDDGDRHVIVAKDGLLQLKDGTITRFSVTPSGGSPVIPFTLAIARDGLRPLAWLTSDQGLLRLDEDTFAVQQLIKPEDIGHPGSFTELAVDPDTGDVYAGFFPSDGNATRVVKVTVAGERTQLVMGQGDAPEGRVGQIVWSQKDDRAYIAVASWDPAGGGVIGWDGDTVEHIVTEAQLSKERGAFGASTLALDDDAGVLAVGGLIQGNPVGPAVGGGLAWVDLSTPNEVAFFDDTGHPFVGLNVRSLQLDPTTKRTYAILSGLCSSARLRSYGVVAISFADRGVLRVERLAASGVRAIATLDGDLLLGLRDEFPGAACNGLPVQTGLVEVRANGALEVSQVRNDDITPMPGITAMEAVAGHGIGMVAWRDAVFFGTPALGVAENPTFLGPSLFLEDVALDIGDTRRDLWVASRASHQPGDDAALADKGPRGAARIAIDQAGDFGNVVHFVRTDPDPKKVSGLPTSDVRDVLADGRGGAWLACAREVVDTSSADRAEEPPFELEGKQRPGGVVHVDAEDELTVLTTSEQTPDPRVLAREPSGDLLIADADKGLLRLTDEGLETVSWGATVPEGAVPHALWVSADGTRRAAGFDKGLSVVFDGYTPRFFDGVGFVWTLFEHAGWLLAGTDEGLLMVAPSGTPAVNLPAGAQGAAMPFTTSLPLDDNGSSGGDCIPKGQSCAGDRDGCCAGLSCGGSGFVPECS